MVGGAFEGQAAPWRLALGQAKASSSSYGSWTLRGRVRCVGPCTARAQGAEGESCMYSRHSLPAESPNHLMEAGFHHKCKVL